MLYLLLLKSILSASEGNTAFFCGMPNFEIHVNKERASQRWYEHLDQLHYLMSWSSEYQLQLRMTLNYCSSSHLPQVLGLQGVPLGLTVLLSTKQVYGYLHFSIQLFTLLLCRNWAGIVASFYDIYKISIKSHSKVSEMTFLLKHSICQDSSNPFVS